MQHGVKWGFQPLTLGFEIASEIAKWRCNKTVMLLLVLLLELPLWSAQRSRAADMTSRSCKDGYYMTSVGCLPCSVCLSNETIVRPCTNTSNSLCVVQCSINNTSSPQYVDLELSANGSHCKNCTKCADLNREETAQCSSVRDSACGSCLAGYFQGVTREGVVKCLPCSRCPPGDDTAIKWQQCQNAGLDPSMWCSPGYTSGSSSNGATRSSSATSLEVLGEGNFLSFTFQSVLQNDGGASNAVVVIAVLTVAATFLTIVVTVCSITVCTVRQCRRANADYYRVGVNYPSTPMEEQGGP